MFKKLLRFLVSPCPISLGWLPWVICFGGLFIEITFCYPGQCGNDPLTQFFQAGNGIIGDWHPPIMAATWQVVRFAVHTLTGERIIGNGIMWGLYASFLWAGFFLVLSSAKNFWRNSESYQKNYLLVLCSAALLLWLCIDLFMIGMSLSKDVGFLGSYLIVTGCLLCIPAARKSRWIFYVVAVTFLFYGTALRHNAIFAAIPFLCWLVWLIAPQKKLRTIIPAGLILWCVLLAGIHYVNYGVIKAVQLHALQEIFYCDIFHLNALTNRFVLPPNGFGNDFSRLNETIFRQTFDGNQLYVRECFKNFNEGKTWENQLILDRSTFVPCSPVQMDMEQKHIDEIIRHFPLATNIVAVNADFVRQQYAKDMAVLKTVWIERVCDAPIAYLKFKARFFLKLCRDNYLYFGRFNAIPLFPLCFMILLYSFSKRLLNTNLFPCVMLMWSGCLYLAPLFLFLPADIIRYLYWFYAASFISIALFCANSPLFAEITQTVQRYFQRKLNDEH